MSPLFIFSKDYKTHPLGLFTKARLHDKWAHFAGSGMLLILGILGIWVAHQLGYRDGKPLTEIWDFRPICWMITILTWGGGLAYEIHQGVTLGEWIHKDPEHRTMTDKGVLYSDNEEVDPDYYTEPPSDGFSWVDLAANTLGIGAVWALLIALGVV